MKKQFILSTILLSAAFYGKAQLTINSSNINTVGNQIMIATDTMPDASLDFGGNGNGQNWDFSSLKATETDVYKFISPAGAVRAGDFPTANLVVNYDNDEETWVFIENSSSRLMILGFAAVYSFDGISDTSVIDFNTTLITFPSSLGTTYNERVIAFDESFEFSFDPDGAGPHPMVDSLRTKSTTYTNSEIIAEGKVTMPDGTYDALHQYAEEISADSVFMFANGNWSLLSTEMQAALFMDAIYFDTTIYHRWWTNDNKIGYPLVALSLYSFTTEYFVDWVKTGPVNVGMEENTAKNWTLYPNPANSTVNINFQKSFDGQFTFKLYNLSGQKVNEYFLSGIQNEVVLEGLKNGAYFYELVTPDQQRAGSGKLIIRQ